MTQTGDIKRRINWINTVFLLTTPLMAFVGVPLLIWFDQIHWGTWVLTFLMAVATGLSITAGYHRLFTHRSYEAKWLVRLFFLIFGAASFENSAKFWCSDHREHHQNVDTEEDPYNIKKGFFHAHMGWIFFKREEGKSFENIADLLKDPLIRFQDRYYYLIASLFGLFLPMGIGALWGDPLGGFFLAGIARVVFNHHATFLINSFCHHVGKQPYSDNNTSKDSWLMAFLTYGEGYHNFHHSFQADYRNGFRKYHWDPTKWAIHILKWLQLAKNLRSVPNEKIMLARLRMQEKRLLDRLQLGKMAAVQTKEKMIQATRLRLEEAYARFLNLKTKYQKLKKGEMDVMREVLKRLKEELRETRWALKEAEISWSALYRSILKEGAFVTA